MSAWNQRSAAQQGTGAVKIKGIRCARDVRTRELLLDFLRTREGQEIPPREFTMLIARELRKEGYRSTLDYMQICVCEVAQALVAVGEIGYRDRAYYYVADQRH